jgi:hypothetical protein
MKFWVCGDDMAWSNGDWATAATAAVAVLAFFRPDFEHLSRRWRANIDMHATGRLEVGLSNFGPTIGLQGTLQAIRGDVFVSFSRLIVERVSDNLHHEFQWAVFRGTQLSAAPQTFEIASGFLLSVAAPRRFNIQFHDSGTADAFRQPLIDLQRLWTDYLQAQKIVPVEIAPDQIRDHYNQFHQTRLSDITPLFQIIDRQFYWIAGQYRIRLELYTTRPAKRFIYNYRFELSDAESRLLHLNCIGCLMAACSVPNVVYNFANPVYTAQDEPRR